MDIILSESCMTPTELNSELNMLNHLLEPEESTRDVAWEAFNDEYVSYIDKSSFNDIIGMFPGRVPTNQEEEIAYNKVKSWYELHYNAIYKSVDDSVYDKWDSEWTAFERQNGGKSRRFNYDIDCDFPEPPDFSNYHDFIMESVIESLSNLLNEDDEEILSDYFNKDYFTALPK